MAQIGSPSAGWYTDPSGQHRARYWDGASWTEQVRDDLTRTAETVGATPAAPNPPTPGPPTAHPVADTVAGVAEAVAAVAANDVAPTVEPPLVVDYGTDAPWGAVSGNGHEPAAGGPLAATAPVAEVPPTPVAPQAAPTVEVPVPTAPEPAPATPSAPVASGPAAGWYPDPASRHQARLWDGTGWTERVADNGVEGVDPLPGASAATTTTVDPAVGTWSAELQDTAETVPVGPDGKPMSAGQMSLASLPDAPEPEVVPEQPAPARPTVKVRVGGGFVLGGAVALLIGSAMSWIEITGPKVGDETSSTGLALGDGRITLALGIVLAVLGAAIITGRMGRFGGVKVAAMGSLVAGAAALAVTAVDIADVADRASRLGVGAGAVSNVGMGLWVAFIGALFAVGGGLMTFANRQ